MASFRTANQARYFFVCGELEENCFQVERFSGQDKISSPYSFSVTLRSNQSDISSKDILCKQATLYMFREGEYFSYSGAVIEFSYLESTADYSIYNLKLVPKLKLLDFNHQTRVFLKMSIPQIIAKVLEDAQLAHYYRIEIEGNLPLRETVLQYQESDLNFITRLMDEAGLCYFFEEQPLLPQETGNVNSETLVISNKPSSFNFILGGHQLIFKSPSAMEFEETTESVSSLISRNCAVSEKVLVKNYNYRTPEVNLCTTKNLESGNIGTVYQYGKEFPDMDGAQHAVELLGHKIVSGSSQAIGKSNCAGFRAGARFELSGHHRDECNDVFLISEISHSGNNSSMNGKAHISEYSNEFISVFSELIDKFKPSVDVKIPKINGVFTATVEADGAEYANLDEMGRYKIRMPFDISEAPNSNASKYVRLAQPYSGSNYGVHFPAREGAEMVLACIDGNPNRPVGLGMVPNANTISPVVSTNKTQNVIRTAGKNEILMDDETDKQKIRITTAALNCMGLDDENKMAFIQTSEGNHLSIDDCNQCSVWKTKDHSVSMSYKEGKEEIVITTAKGHVIKIDDAKQCISLCTEKGHTVQLDDESGTIVLSDCKQKNSVTLDSQQGLILDSKGGISITAAKDIVIEGQNLNLASSVGEINVSATRDVAISAMNISGDAQMEYALKGTNVNLKAQMKAAIEGGMGTEVKSNLQTKIAGTMTEISGDGINTIKGGVVMIN